jgi:hypothetical protein
VHLRLGSTTLFVVLLIEAEYQIHYWHRIYGESGSICVDMLL